MKKVFITAMILVTTSCAMLQYPAMPAERWYKQGTTAQDARVSNAKCIYDVGMNKVDPTEKNTLIASCMEAKGFIWGVSPDDKEKWEQKVKMLKKQGYQLY
ncbi:hypothetical protein L5B71_04365 [Avibacterium sp. 21-586]|uniref:hypothetical protein n=1 Tax=Avibacterium sp. 21-586 TaxID=2911534 RepID=UPI0022453010|nr:hypothetical protein [Avibacterium sp. 21-586]MCW9710116.1 hypothetical protein [Avibacterium sp. 21-586]